MKHLVIVSTLIIILQANSAFADFINWTDWDDETQYTMVEGSIAGSIGVDVTYEGAYSFAQLGTGTNYWTEGTPAPYTGSVTIDNPPLPAEMIAINGQDDHSITFSSPVTNPVMAIVSLGNQLNVPVAVDYEFDQAFNFISEGEGYWGDGTYSILGNTLTGNEFHGVIQFIGEISQISWASVTLENWHGFTVGVPGEPVPEPFTMLLMGTGLAGIAGMRLRRKKI